MQPAYLPITARQNVDLEIPLTIKESGVGVPVTGWVFTLQVRREAGEPGDPIIEISSDGTSGGDGVEIVDEDGGVLLFRVTWETLNSEGVPAGRLAYDAVADLPGGFRWGLLYGEFIAKPGVSV